MQDVLTMSDSDLSTAGTHTLGLVAGMGTFPHEVVSGAVRAGRRVVVLGLRDYADASLAGEAAVFRWIPIARVGRWIRLMKRYDVHEVIFAGGVRKTEAFRRFRILRYLPDWRTLRIWYRRSRDRRNLSILAAVADELADEGITVVNSVQYCADSLADEGVMGRVSPTDEQQRSIEFGWPLAVQIADADIGQSIAVYENDVMAVEAIEGTDAMIARAGTLCRRSGWTLLKVSQTHQDMRFDVPTTGVATIEQLHQHGGRCLVLEAGRTLMLEKEKMLAAADKRGVAVVGRVRAL